MKGDHFQTRKCGTHEQINELTDGLTGGNNIQQLNFIEGTTTSHISLI